MRDLKNDEFSLVNGGFGGERPLGSPTASSYFGRCMNYVSPNGTTSAALALTALIPGAGMAVGFLGAVHAIGALGVCGLGTLQYAQ
jgi:hypothetical protein